MNDGRRFEDKVSVSDFMKMPQKELMAHIYIQTLKTNGTVKDHEERLNCVEKDYMHKDDIKVICTDLRAQLDEKIDWKPFKRLGVIITTIIAILTIPNLILNVIKYIEIMSK